MLSTRLVSCIFCYTDYQRPSDLRSLFCDRESVVESILHSSVPQYGRYLGMEVFAFFLPLFSESLHLVVIALLRSFDLHVVQL